MTSTPATVKEPGSALLLEAIARADAPTATEADRAALRRMYNEVPAFWQAIGDLSTLAQALLIDTALGADYSTREALAHKLRAIRDELGYASASQLERLLIEQIVLCYIRTQLDFSGSSW